MLKGMKDGRKRALFVFVNFLVNLGWSYDQIEDRINEWNRANPEPLKEVLIQGHLRYHRQQQKKILPPNFSNKAYYPNMEKYAADSLCMKVKNPVTYAKLRARMASEVQEKKYKKPEDNPDLSEAQKEFIMNRKRKEKEFREKMKEMNSEKVP